ncbi:MAG: DNA topology modulation protein FlaR [Oscillospiraceae bacterium]|nr:DNA topology modulation protein FlaR [Oscillospiraceae bacterium]
MTFIDASRKDLYLKGDSFKIKHDFTDYIIHCFILSVKERRKEGIEVKIAVIGYSGSGKSTLARKLGEKFSTDVLHLDSVFWLPGWKERSGEDMCEQVKTFLDTHSDWVIDGNYSGILFERRMEEADRIVLMRFSAPACLRRAWKRYRQYRGHTRIDMGEGCPEKMDLEFIWWILYRGRRKSARDRLRQVMENYPEKVAVIRNQRELDAYERMWGLCPK